MTGRPSPGTTARPAGTASAATRSPMTASSWPSPSAARRPQRGQLGAARHPESGPRAHQSRPGPAATIPATIRAPRRPTIRPATGRATARTRSPTETTWGPNGDVMVSMYKSKLYFNTVARSTAHVGHRHPARAGVPHLGGEDRSLPVGSVLEPRRVAAGLHLVQPGRPPIDGNRGSTATSRWAVRSRSPTPRSETITDDAHVLVDRAEQHHQATTRASARTAPGSCSTRALARRAMTPAHSGRRLRHGICDGYDDSSAESVVGSDWGRRRDQPRQRQRNASGVNYDNSWPRFSPDVEHLPRLRRSTGSPSLRGDRTASRPTRAASPRHSRSSGSPASRSSEVNAGDPSHAPVWLPGQNPTGNPYGNHVPQWVKVAIVIDTGH